MPSKKSARKQSEKKDDEVDWRAFIGALGQFKKDGTGSPIDHELLEQFPLFHGSAPAGHPYPQAFTDTPSDPDYCFVQAVDDMVLLRHILPSGRVISVDTCDFAMLNGGAGIAHLNMNSGDNRVSNLKEVKEAEARDLLLGYVEQN